MREASFTKLDDADILIVEHHALNITQSNGCAMVYFPGCHEKSLFLF
jgi:hypothetical protein